MKGSGNNEHLGVKQWYQVWPFLQRPRMWCHKVTSDGSPWRAQRGGRAVALDSTWQCKESTAQIMRHRVCMKAIVAWGYLLLLFRLVWAITNVWVSVTSFTGTILADDRLPSCCLGCPHTLSTCKKGREHGVWVEKLIYNPTKIRSLQLVFTARDIVWVRERKDRKDSSFKELETNALQKKDQIPRQSKEHQKVSSHGFVSGYLDYSTLGKAEAVTDKVLANQTFI